MSAHRRNTTSRNQPIEEVRLHGRTPSCTREQTHPKEKRKFVEQIMQNSQPPRYSIRDHLNPRRFRYYKKGASNIKA